MQKIREQSTPANPPPKSAAQKLTQAAGMQECARSMQPKKNKQNLKTK